MLDFDGHLIKIKNIPHRMKETEFLGFLRAIWQVVEGDALISKGPIGAWYRLGGEYEILSRSEETAWWSATGYKYFEGRAFALNGDGFILVPSFLKSFFVKPVFLRIASYYVAPADIDQMDITNALMVCRARGGQSEQGGWNRVGKYGGVFGIAPLETGELAIGFIADRGAEMNVISFLPEAEEAKDEWQW